MDAKFLGLTPLHVACVEGQLAVVKMLVAAGAQTNLPNNNGSTPLDLAEENGHTAVVKWMRANRRRGAASTVAGPISSAEDRAAAERAAEAAAAALLAEEAEEAKVPAKGGGRAKSKSGRAKFGQF